MSDQNIPVTADSNVQIDCDNNDNNTDRYIQFSHDNGTELMRIQENGNVGIGTNNPRSLLQIDSSSSDHLKLRVHTESYATDNVAGLGFGVDTVNQYMKSAIVHQRKDSNGEGDLLFCVDSNNDGANVAVSDEKMRIDSNGNVGIGTTVPSEILTIHETDPVLLIRGSTPYFKINYGDDATKVGIGCTAAGSGGRLQLYEGQPSDAKKIDLDADGICEIKRVLNIDGEGAAQDEDGADMSFLGQDGGTASSEPGTDGGDIIITPGGKNGTGSDGNILLAKDKGNVGIGTTNPGQKLHIVGTGDIYEEIETDDSVGSDLGLFLKYGSSYQAQFKSTNTVAGKQTYVGSFNGPLNIMSNNATRMTIDNDGKVGIGTTSPNSEADVNGTVQCDTLRIDQTPTSGSIEPSHYFTINLNGTTYQVPCLLPA